jgi:glycosyltransferase involved in cell wall biosynthesis
LSKTLPLVSIVIPIYNQNSDYLRQCLNSALAQTYSNIEIIASDNHSTNEVLSILQGYQDKRLKIVRPPEHLPITPHFQWLSEQAQGEYISFLCSDDWLEETCIAELVHIVHPNPNVVAGFCNVKLWSKGVLSNFVYIQKGIFPSKNELKAYIQFGKVKGNLVGNLLKREVYQKVGGIAHGGLSFTADKWLLIQMAAKGDIAYTDNSLSVFRIDNPLRGSRRLTYIKEIQELYVLIEKHYLGEIEGGQAIIKRDKKTMALDDLGVISQLLKQGEMSKQDFTTATHLIQKLSDAPSVQFVCRFFKYPLFVQFYPFIYYIQRKKYDFMVKLKNLTTTQQNTEGV